MTSPAIEEFIRAVRDSFVGAEHVYTNGSCYYFARILKLVYPEGQIVENIRHCYFRLGDRLYDIRGECADPGNLRPVEEPTLHGKFDMIQWRDLRDIVTGDSDSVL